MFVFFVGTSFFPKAEKPQFLINIYTPEGTSIEGTDRAVSFVEGILSEREEIKHYVSNIGHGNPRIYYNVYSELERSNYGQVFVELKSYDLAVMNNLLGEVRTDFSGYPGAQIEIKELEQGPPLEAPIAIKILAKDLERLQSLSRVVERRFLETPGVVNVYNPLKTIKTDIQVKINREKAGLFGLSLADIDMAVRAGLSGLAVSTFRDREGRDYDIVLRLKGETTGAKPRIFDFNRIYIATAAGSQIPLKQVAAIEFKSGPVEVRHYNQERSVTITADVLGLPKNAVVEILS